MTKYKDRDWLYNEYVVKDRTIKDIASELGVVFSTISVWTRKLDIKKEPKDSFNNTDVGILCHGCKKEFLASLRYLVRKIRDGYSRFYCCKECVNKAVAESQKGEKNNMRGKKGALNPYWKGGVTNISEFSRSALREWKLSKLRESGFTCFVSGRISHNLHIHHVTPFHEIRDKALSELGINIRQNISEYTQDELDSVNNKIIQLHEEEKGYAMDAELHKLFHSIYGFRTNEQDLFEFKTRYQTGEFIGKEVI